MKKLLFLLLLSSACTQVKPLVHAPVSQETALKEIKGNLVNDESQLDKPYVILVSIDGFRYDYATKYGAKKLLDFDVKAEKMIPTFPSKTFPNHYAIVSGLYPGHNGLVSNNFYDRNLDLTYKISDRSVVENPDFYNGTPLWVLAEENKMVNASMFWVGSEAPIKGKMPTYYYKYDGDISNQDRVNQTITWLQLPPSTRPHFITLYFSITDDIGHRHGPESDEIAAAVKNIDATIGDLMSKVDQLPFLVNVIVVSDHGMIEVDREQVIYLDTLIPEDMKITSSFPAMVYSNDSDRIDSIYQKLKSNNSNLFDVYLKNDLPERFHYTKNLERIGDLVIMPKAPYTFGRKNRPIAAGSSTHGYDPKLTPEMGAIFYAKGPSFKTTTIAPFENIHVYPMIAKILNLEFNPKSIDGKLKVLSPILKQ